MNSQPFYANMTKLLAMSFICSVLVSTKKMGRLFLLSNFVTFEVIFAFSMKCSLLHALDNMVFDNFHFDYSTHGFDCRTQTHHLSAQHAHCTISFLVVCDGNFPYFSLPYESRYHLGLFFILFIYLFLNWRNSHSGSRHLCVHQVAFSFSHSDVLHQNCLPCQVPSTYSSEQIYSETKYGKKKPPILQGKGHFGGNLHAVESALKERVSSVLSWLVILEHEGEAMGEQMSGLCSPSQSSAIREKRLHRLGWYGWGKKYSLGLHKDICLHISAIDMKDTLDRYFRQICKFSFKSPLYTIHVLVTFSSSSISTGIWRSLLV